MYHSRTKHIKIQFGHVTKLTEAGAIKIEYCHIKWIIADILTKRLPKDTFNNLCQLLEVLPPVSTGSASSSLTEIVPSKKRGGTSLPPFICKRCSNSFPSRNALFNHLQNTGHFHDTDSELIATEGTGTNTSVVSFSFLPNVEIFLRQWCWSVTYTPCYPTLLGGYFFFFFLVRIITCMRLIPWGVSLVT